jgi:hypothetical protein
MCSQRTVADLNCGREHRQQHRGGEPPFESFIDASPCLTEVRSIVASPRRGDRHWGIHLDRRMPVLRP